MPRVITKYKNIFLWWLTFSAIWGVYRLFDFPEFFSEVIAKPIVWLGITLLFFMRGFIPQKVFIDLKTNYTHLKPIWKVILLPSLFIILYFVLINFRQIKTPDFSILFLTSTLVTNFLTGIVEEIIYRGILYVWLLQKTDEITAFVLVQILFVLGHVPTLILNSDSLSAGLVHAFFIILIGTFHTLIFRLTKSIYASSVTHGIWNSLAYYFLLS